MYVTMKTILDDANKNFYGVISASVINLELVRGAIRAAQEENAPIVINIGQGQMSKHGDGEIISGIVRTLVARATVPVALNLDHCKDYERITHAFRHQFSSIMIDASEYPLEENIRRTKEVVTLCHSQNVTVEGEIGFIGQAANADEKNWISTHGLRTRCISSRLPTLMPWLSPWAPRMENTRHILPPR